MGVGSVSKQETIPQMFKVSETTTITFHILDDAIKSLHRPIRESASVGAVSTHPFDHNERVDYRFEVVIERVSYISEQFET